VITDTLQQCIDAAKANLREGESIIQIRLAEPLLQSHADYFTRYKVDVGLPNPSGTEVSSRRCLVVEISSNTGKTTVNQNLGWDPIPNIAGL